MDGRQSQVNAELRKGGVELAGATLLSLVLLDVLFPQVSLAVLFALSPMVACAVLPPKPTAAFGVAALSAAVASHWWTDDSNLAQHVVRVAGVVAFSATAAVVAHIRVRREHELQHMSRLAEVAQRAVLPVLPAHARDVHSHAGTARRIGPFPARRSLSNRLASAHKDSGNHDRSAEST